MLKYYTQNGNRFGLKPATPLNMLRIVVLLIAAGVALYFTTKGVGIKNVFILITVFLFCSSFAVIYLLKLSKKLIIDKDLQQISIKENFFSKTETFDLKYFTQVHTSQSTTNFVPVAASASLIFYINEMQSVAVLEQKYFSTVSSLEKLINETKTIINQKK